MNDRDFLKQMRIDPDSAPKYRRVRMANPPANGAYTVGEVIDALADELIRVSTRYDRLRLATGWMIAGLCAAFAAALWWLR